MPKSRLSLRAGGHRRQKSVLIAGAGSETIARLEQWVKRHG